MILTIASTTTTTITTAGAKSAWYNTVNKPLRLDEEMNRAVQPLNQYNHHHHLHHTSSNSTTAGRALYTGSSAINSMTSFMNDTFRNGKWSGV